MRFIIREQEYEQLIVAGRLKYQSGAIESWRLTEAVDGFLVMRVDLDRRYSDADGSMLIHLLLDSDRRLERLKLLDLAPNRPASVDVLSTDSSLSISRAIGNDLIHDELEQPAGFGVLVPGFIGLGLIAQHSRSKGNIAAVKFDVVQRYEPSLASVEINELANEETIAVTGQPLAVRPYLIRPDETSYTVYLDEYGIPVRVDDEEGRLAIDDRYVRHR